MEKGIGASPGIAIGKAKLLNKKERVIPQNGENPIIERERLKSALEAAEADIHLTQEMTKNKLGASEAMIFEAHLMMLQDPEFIQQIETQIQSGKSAPYGVRIAADEFIAMFEAIEDAYLRERAADLKDVAQRLIDKLLGIEPVDFTEKGIILIAEDLSPSDTAKIDGEYVLGFVTEIGGTTSHSAIMARTMGIPAVVGLGSVIRAIRDGEMIAIDGNSGEVFIDPDRSILENLKAKNEQIQQEKNALKTLFGQPSVTADGHLVELACNIGGVKDLKHVIENDGEGIGLFRSEFLYMDRSQLPSEAEQFEAYKAVLEGMKGKPVVIRTLDIGGDKNLPYLNIPKEENPFLGFRAIRYCLKNEKVFKTQIKALLRAGVYGDLRIMLPMISGVEEIRAAKRWIEVCKRELAVENQAYSQSYQLGIMIEIPSAAIMSDVLAKEVDFFSIGTNDLIQYTVAVDRMNQDIASLYTPYHPAVLRLIHQVIKAGKSAGIWVGMCGEAAGNPTLMPLLLGMGLEEFSMSPSKLLGARALVQKMKFSELEIHVEAVLKLSTPEEVESYLKKL